MQNRSKAVGVILCSWCVLPLLATVCSAAPRTSTITVLPPIGSAKTIQVTEAVYEAGSGATPGPLRRAGSMTFVVQRPDKFIVTWFPETPESGPYAAPSVFVSDGTTLTIVQGKHFTQRHAATSEWPFPLVGLLNNAPPGGPIRTTPGTFNGHAVLLGAQDGPTVKSQFAFDPKSHLLVSSSMFIIWKGKSVPVERTDYSGWSLNKPLPASTFQWVTPKGITKAG